MARYMVMSAIKTAARMGIGLTEGQPVEALGNCLLESVKGNIEDRDIFQEKIEESIDDLREKIVKEGERVIGASPYRIEDYSDEDWALGWDQLRISGIWDVEYFGDLMIIALAHVIGKNILLINSDAPPGSTPVTVVLGDRFGKPLNSEHPVILAYSGTHYESLIPVLDRDEMRSRRMIKKYINGEDLFSQDEEEEVIMTRGIVIQKEPFIDNWCEPDMTSKNNVLNSETGSYIDDTVQNPDSGLDNWKKYHPDSTKSELFNNNITWNHNPQQSFKTISIPINITD